MERTAPAPACRIPSLMPTRRPAPMATTGPRSVRRATCATGVHCRRPNGSLRPATRRSRRRRTPAWRRATSRRAGSSDPHEPDAPRQPAARGLKVVARRSQAGGRWPPTAAVTCRSCTHGGPGIRPARRIRPPWVRSLGVPSDMKLSLAAGLLAGTSLLAGAAGTSGQVGPATHASSLPEPRLSWRASVPPAPPPASAADWRRSNDLVRRLGGHAGHWRARPGEAEAPAAAGDGHPRPPAGAPR